MQKHTSEDTDVTQNTSPPSAASPASFPHVLLSFRSLTLIIFRGTTPFPQSWLICLPHCLCLIVLFIQVFFHVFISSSMYSFSTLLQNVYKAAPKNTQNMIWQQQKFEVDKVKGKTKQNKTKIGTQNGVEPGRKLIQSVYTPQSPTTSAMRGPNAWRQAF